MDVSMRSAFEAGSVDIHESVNDDGTPLSRADRAHKFGLDCPMSLSWHGGTWQPGGEFIKTLTVRNATNRTIHVKYVLPATKFFFMAYPDPLSLAPGVSKALEVRFRPIKYEEYNDFIVFTTDFGTFKVPIAAKLARLIVKVSPEMHFGVVPVNEPSTAQIAISNEGEVEAMFEWNAPRPFLLTPKTGRVLPGQTFPVTVTVLPSSATILRADAVCDIQGGELQLPVTLTAHGKYQHIAVEPAELDWGQVPVGASTAAAVERTVTVRNLGSVRCTVDIEQVDATAASHSLIVARPTTMGLMPGQSGAFKLRYKPETAGVSTCERFLVSTPGGGAHVVTCTARCIGPVLTIARKDPTGSPPSKRPLSIQFGDCKIGESVTQVVTLTNHSREPSCFDLECEDSGVFGWSDTKGTVPANSYKHLVVRFHPRIAGNYYRRVQCLVLNGDPVFVDLIGTAFDDKTRPAPLKQRHVDAARLRPTPVRMLAPDTMLQVVQAGQAATQATASSEAEWQLTAIRARSGDRSRAANALYSEYFSDPTGSDNTVSLLEDLLEFKPTRRGALTVEQKTVHVVNRTAAKMTVQWMVPASKASGKDADPGDPFHPPPADFSVYPERTELEPGSSAEFRVSFVPTLDAYYYFQELECWVAPKVNRSFRLVDDASFTPPTCLSLKVLGHTFRDAEAFAPMISTSFGGTATDQALTMPPCALGDCVYYTFQLLNTGEVPTVFEWSADPSGTFTVQPSVGMLPVRSFQLITVRFAPRHARAYANTFGLTLNHDPTHMHHITLRGHGDAPRLLLPESGMMYIKPTSLGLTSSRTLTLRNVSRVPLRFELRPPSKYAHELRLSTTRGDIDSNGSVDITVTFAPRRTGLHRLYIPVLVYPATGSEANSLVLLDALSTGRDISALEEDMHRAIPGEVVTPQGSRTNTPESGLRSGRGASATGRNRSTSPPPSSSSSVLSGLGLPGVTGSPAGGASSGLGHVPGEPMQRLTLTVVSEGTFGALSFDTRYLDFGAALVHGRVSAPIYIENRSDCTLRYNLDAIIQLQMSSVDMDRDDSGIVEMSEVDAEFEDARWYAARRKMSGGNLVVQRGAAGPRGSVNEAGEEVLDEDGEQDAMTVLEEENRSLAAASASQHTMGGPAAMHMLGDRSGPKQVTTGGALRGETSLHDNGAGAGARRLRGLFTRTVSLSIKDPRAQYRSRAPGEHGDIKPILWFDRPTGVIAAHSKIRVEVAFSPAIAATFRCRIYYHIQTDDGRSLNVDSRQDGAEALITTFSASRHAALAAAAEAETDPRDPAMVDWESEPRNSNELVCDAVGVGAYPTVCVEDARLLTSREALLTLFPHHFAGTHNGFRPEKVRDKTELLAMLGLDKPGSGSPGRAGSTASAHASIVSVGGKGSRAGPGSVLSAHSSVAAGGGLAAVRNAANGSGSVLDTSVHSAGPASGNTSAIIAYTDGRTASGAPRPSPHDLWVRPGAWNKDAVVWGSAEPETKGWGGWRVALPDEVDAAGGFAHTTSNEQLPVPRVSPDLISALYDEHVSSQPVPSGAGALWRLWSQFSLRELNRYLSTRLSADEVQYNSATQMTRDPTRLAAFALEFAPAPLGSPPSVLLLHFRNSGKLPADVSFTMPHERDVDREPWVEVDEPSADELQDNELLERHIFNITPRRLQLMPGQAATVRVHYAYGTMINAGAHEIVVMLRVRHGKPVRLFLRGRTLAPLMPYLYCGVPSRVIRLSPVPLGVRPEDAPLQTVPLYNPSAVPVRWRVSIASLRALAEANFGVEVLRALNKGGIIPAGGEGALQLAFTPLETRTYRVRLDIAFVSTRAYEFQGQDGAQMAEGKEDGPASRGVLARGLSTGSDGSSSGRTAAEMAEADEVRQLKKLLKVAQGLNSKATGSGGETVRGRDAAAGQEGSSYVETVAEGAMPDVGVGLATGQEGYEADYPGILQLRVVCQGYASVNALSGVAGMAPNPAGNIPLMPVAPTIGLGLAPAAPPEDSGPTPLSFESTLQSEVLPVDNLTAVAKAAGARRRNSVVYAPPASPRSSRPPGLLHRSRWGNTAGHDALADGIYAICGLDAMSAAVSTGHNPLDTVTSLEGVPGAMFTGPDAEASAMAAAQLARAQAVLARLEAVPEPKDGIAPGMQDGSLLYGLPQGSDVASDGAGSAVVVPPTLARDGVLANGRVTDAFMGGPAGQVALVAGPSAARPGSPNPAADLYSLMGRLGSPASLKAFCRPGALPPLFVGAYPPFRQFAHLPHADVPEGFASISTTWLRFGDLPTRAVQHALVILRHHRKPEGDGAGVMSNAADATVPPGPLQFAFDASHPLVASGILKFSPPRGLVEPGEAVAVRVTLHAPLEAAVLAADVACIVSVTPAEQRARASALLRRSVELRDMFARKKAGAKSAGALIAHVSVAEKTTVSRSQKLEATARELAWRTANKIAQEEEQRGKSVYTDKAAQARRARQAGAGAAGLTGLIPGMGSGTDAQAGRRRNDKPAGNAVHLLAAAAEDHEHFAREDLPAVDATSVDPTVGEDRPRMAAEAAKVRAAELRAAVADARRARSGSPGGASAATGDAGSPSAGLDAGVSASSTLHDEDDGVPPAYRKDDSDLGRRLMRTVVKDGLGYGPSATGTDKPKDRELLDHIVSGGLIGGPRGPGAATGHTASPLGTDETTQKYLHDHTMHLEHDPEGIRRIRIASRARNRLSPPRTAQSAAAQAAQQQAEAFGDSNDGQAWADGAIADGKEAESTNNGALAVVQASRAGGRSSSPAAGRFAMLPPPPHAALFLHITARVCGAAEFTQAYTPAHLSAFFHPGGLGARLPLADGQPAAQALAGPTKATGADAEDAAARAAALLAGEEPKPLTVDVDVVRSVLATLVADTVTDPLLAPLLDKAAGLSIAPPSALGTATAAGETAVVPGGDPSMSVRYMPRVATASGSLAEGQVAGHHGDHGQAPLPMDVPLLPSVEAGRDLLEGGLTFAQLKAAGGDISRVPSRRAVLRAGTALPTTSAAPAADVGAQAPAVRSVFDCGVPGPRGDADDLDITADPEAASVLHDASARETVERVLESALLALARDIVDGAWDPMSDGSKATKAAAQGLGDEGQGPTDRPALDGMGFAGLRDPGHGQASVALDGDGDDGFMGYADGSTPADLELDEQERAMLAAMAARQAQAGKGSAGVPPLAMGPGGGLPRHSAGMRA